MSTTTAAVAWLATGGSVAFWFVWIIGLATVLIVGGLGTFISVSPARRRLVMNAYRVAMMMAKVVPPPIVTLTAASTTQHAKPVVTTTAPAKKKKLAWKNVSRAMLVCGQRWRDVTYELWTNPFLIFVEDLIQATCIDGGFDVDESILFFVDTCGIVYKNSGTSSINLHSDSKMSLEGAKSLQFDLPQLFLRAPGSDSDSSENDSSGADANE